MSLHATCYLIVCNTQVNQDSYIAVDVNVLWLLFLGQNIMHARYRVESKPFKLHTGWRVMDERMFVGEGQSVTPCLTFSQ